MDYRVPTLDGRTIRTTSIREAYYLARRIARIRARYVRYGFPEQTRWEFTIPYGTYAGTVQVHCASSTLPDS